jgi:hypothetical protein
MSLVQIGGLQSPKSTLLPIRSGRRLIAEPVSSVCLRVSQRPPSDGTQVGLNVGIAWECGNWTGAFRVADKGDWGEPDSVGVSWRHERFESALLGAELP